MKEVDQKAQRDIPGLRRRLSQLLDLVIEIIKEPLETSDKDHFRLMAFCFLGRQVEHAKTILLLVDNEHEIDAQLICRSMIEGLTQFLWTASDSQARALLWRGYTFVEVWRQIQKKKEMNEPVDESLLSYVSEGLSIYGEKYHTSKTRNRKEKNRPLPKDPYYKNWYGYNLSRITKEVEGELIYHEIYKFQAAWHHWSPASFGKVISGDNFNKSLSYISPVTTAQVLSCSLLCLGQTAELYNNHLKLGFEDRLRKARDELIAWHKNQ